LTSDWQGDGEIVALKKKKVELEGEEVISQAQ